LIRVNLTSADSGLYDGQSVKIRIVDTNELVVLKNNEFLGTKKLSIDYDFERYVSQEEEVFT